MWNNRRRRLVQRALAPVVVVVLALGWRYPCLGFIVPLVMLTGMAGGFLRGRYVCGNLCPLGGFLDRVMPALSPAEALGFDPGPETGRRPEPAT